MSARQALISSEPRRWGLMGLRRRARQFFSYKPCKVLAKSDRATVEFQPVTLYVLDQVRKVVSVVRFEQVRVGSQVVSAVDVLRLVRRRENGDEQPSQGGVSAQ